MGKKRTLTYRGYIVCIAYSIHGITVLVKACSLAMETPALKRRKQIICKHPLLSMAACRRLLRKILPPVSPLLNTWSTSMELIVVLVKNEYYELRLEINEEEQ